MLLDKPDQLIELFAENLLWGNITLNTEQIEKNEKHLIELADDLREWLHLRKTKEFESEKFHKLTKKLENMIFIIRFTGIATGVMKNRADEKLIEDLEQNNKQLVNTVAEQKSALDEYIGKAVDTKNIRGIE